MRNDCTRTSVDPIRIVRETCYQHISPERLIASADCEVAHTHADNASPRWTRAGSVYDRCGSPTRNESCATNLPRDVVKNLHGNPGSGDTAIAGYCVTFQSPNVPNTRRGARVGVRKQIRHIN